MYSTFILFLFGAIIGAAIAVVCSKWVGRAKQINLTDMDDNQMMVVYNDELRVIRIIHPNDNLLLGFTRHTLLHVSPYEFVKHVSDENKGAMENMAEVIINVHRSGKPQYLEYPSVSPIDNHLYYALCYVAKVGKHVCASVWQVEADILLSVRQSFVSRNIKGFNLLLDTNRQSIFQYSIREDRFSVLYGSLKLPPDLTLKQMLEHLDESTRQKMADTYRWMRSGELSVNTMVCYAWDYTLREKRYVEVSLGLSCNSGGTPLYIIGSYRDVTGPIIDARRRNGTIQTLLLANDMRICYVELDTRLIFKVAGADGFENMHITLDDYFETIDEEDCKRVKYAISQLIDSKIETSKMVIRRYVFSEKTRRYCRLLMRLEKDGGGKPSRLLAMEVDVDGLSHYEMNDENS